MEAKTPSSDQILALEKEKALIRNKDSFVYKIITGSNIQNMYGMHLIEINDNIQNDPSRDLPGNGEYAITELIIRNDKQSEPLATILLFVPRDKRVWGLMSVQSVLSDEKVTALFETMNVICPRFDYTEEDPQVIIGPPEVENGVATHHVYVTAYNIKNLCGKIIYYSLLGSKTNFNT